MLKIERGSKIIILVCGESGVYNMLFGKRRRRFVKGVGQGVSRDSVVWGPQDLGLRGLN